MGLLNTVKNEIKAAVGYQQRFDELMQSSDITRALSLMSCRSEEAALIYKEYDYNSHKINERQDRAVYNKNGEFLRWSKRHKIVIPYQQYINEIALVFLYGRPVKWSQSSDGTDYAYEQFKLWMKKIRFNSIVREAKRIAGSEKTSAILYHVYKDSMTGQPNMLLNVLAYSNGDDIYVMKDQYKRLQAFAWGYYLTETGCTTVHHVDVYTAEKIYRCKRIMSGWSVDVQINPIGKIPVLLFEQEEEWNGSQSMIERSENLTSTDADVNDRFANPAMVASSEILNSLPKQEEEAKLYIMKNGGEVKYLTWDQASQSKVNEYERLDKHILSKTFTPNIDFDNMKNLGNLSGKAIRKILLIATIKADKRKETHDGYMSRHANLMKAILGNVLDYRHKSEYDALELEHEFQEPFGDDVSDVLADLSKQFNDGALSKETYVEMSYLVKNSGLEMERIKAEQEEAIKQQQEANRLDVFEPTD